MKLVRLFLIMSVVFIFSSCTFKPMWDLEGKWQQKNGDETIEFMKKGVLEFHDNKTSLKTQYSFINKGKIKLDLGVMGTVIMKFSLKGEKLTLTSPEGKIFQFEKVTASSGKSVTAEKSERAGEKSAHEVEKSVHKAEKSEHSVEK